MLSMFVVLLLADKPAGPVATMTPAAIREAIEYGQKAKEMPLYTMEIKRGGFGGGIKIGPAAARENCGFYSTPFARVATMSYRAKQEYKTLTPAEVTAEDLAPELWVFASGNPRKRASRARAIILAGKGNRIIQPLAFEPHPVLYSNAYGATREGTEAFARFPLEALGPGMEIRVVYEGWECVAPIDVKKLR